MRRISLRIDGGQPPGQVVAVVITALDNENNDSGATLHQWRGSLRHLRLAQPLRLVAHEQSPRRSSPRRTTGQQQECDQRQKKEDVEMPGFDVCPCVAPFDRLDDTVLDKRYVYALSRLHSQ